MMIELDITIDPHKHAVDNGYEHWWVINKGTYYEFYWTIEDDNN
jgi:hypothetical protein